MEDINPNGIGRIRLGPIAAAPGECLTEFILANINVESTIITDDWQGYAGLSKAGYGRDVVSSEDLKLPHLIASLLKRWLLGTYQGAVKPTHLSYYLDEFTFRFNRRTSRSRGKLFYRLVQQAAGALPVTGFELKVASQAPDDGNFDVLEL